VFTDGNLVTLKRRILRMYPATAAAAYRAYDNISSHAGSSVDAHTRSTVQELESRVEKQNLLIQTLLMILLEKKVLHEDEFKEWMLYVDELDGVRDGRIRADKTPVACPKCRRNNSAGAVKCQYCGEEIDPEFLVRRGDDPR